MLLSCHFVVGGKGTIKGGGKSLEEDAVKRIANTITGCCSVSLALQVLLATSVCSSEA